MMGFQARESERERASERETRSETKRERKRESAREKESVPWKGADVSDVMFEGIVE